MSLAVAALLVLAGLEALGRVLYPFDRGARSSREARRDHRLGLSYLNAGGDAFTLLRDLYLLEKRYRPFLGWTGAPGVRLATIETNAQGFRDQTVVPRTKGEYRILVTGGSFAWGVGASSNAGTVAGQLESLLNGRGDGRRYRVMNGAFMNWSSHHETVVVAEFFDLFDPDLVISLSGYNDLVMLSKGVELYELPEARMLEQALAEYRQPIGTFGALRKLAGTLGIWRLWVLLRESLDARSLPQQSYDYDPQAGPRRLERALQRYLSIADHLKRNERQYLIALEPEIYSSEKPLTVEEFDLKSRFIRIDQNLMPTLARYRRGLSERLRSYAGERLRFLDLADVYDHETRPVFIDYNHVCDLGNCLVAEALESVVLR